MIKYSHTLKPSHWVNLRLQYGNDAHNPLTLSLLQVKVDWLYTCMVGNFWIVLTGTCQAAAVLLLSRSKVHDA